jgi:hypothetical protein
MQRTDIILFSPLLFSPLLTSPLYIWLGNIAGSMTAGKELEESVRMLYKKYVRGEKVLAGAFKVEF